MFHQIHRCLKCVYANVVVNSSTVNRWVINCCDWESQTISNAKSLKHFRWCVCGIRGSLQPIILQYDNVRVDISRTIEESMRKLELGLKLQHPYSPDFTPSDFFNLLKRGFPGNHSISSYEAKAATKFWIREEMEEYINNFETCKIVILNLKFTLFICSTYVLTTKLLFSWSEYKNCFYCCLIHSKKMTTYLSNRAWST